jgi:hypothetical protein
MSAYLKTIITLLGLSATVSCTPTYQAPAESVAFRSSGSDADQTSETVYVKAYYKSKVAMTEINIATCEATMGSRRVTFTVPRKFEVPVSAAAPEPIQVACTADIGAGQVAANQTVAGTPASETKTRRYPEVIKIVFHQ